MGKNCNCTKLTAWLTQEIEHLEATRRALVSQSATHAVVSAKLDAYHMLLAGLEETHF